MVRLNDFIALVDLSPLHDYCRDNGDAVRYAKGECVVREGAVCRFIGIVRSGYFKYTVLNTNGEECVTGFSFAGEVVTDYVRSFLFSQPSMTSIVAGCDAVVVQVPIAEARPYMISCNPAFIAQASSVLLQEAYRRYLSIHSLTPAQRYANLCTRYMDMIASVPYQELASYLAVSRRQFHRIREAMKRSGGPMG